MNGKKLSSIGVMILFFLLPIASALEISNVRADQVTDKSVVIAWETDEPGKTFVNYGKDKTQLQPLGDARMVTEHRFPLSGLTSETDYFFSVRSNGVTNDNSGQFYSFKTLPPDITAPILEVTIPLVLTTLTTDITGKTEAGATVRLTINTQFSGTQTANPEGLFTFSGVRLKEGENTLLLSTADAAGNILQKEFKTMVDTKAPTLDIEPLPAVATTGEVTVKGKVSEPAKVVITINDREAFTVEGATTVNTNISVDEGENTLKVTATDAAGLTDEFSATLSVDRTPPEVTIQLEQGTTFFQGSAETTITGKTEPGAKVFFYVFRPTQGTTPIPANFERAQLATVADAEGNYQFEDVDLENPREFRLTDLSEDLQALVKDLAPKEVPQGLQQVTIQPISDLGQQEQFQYSIYVIAEDQVGLVNFAQEVVSISRCLSTAFGFRVQPLINFQLPSRIDTDRLDSGVETLTQIVNLTYAGQGAVERDAAGRVVTPGYKMTSYQFEKACTPGMEENDPSFQVSCKVMPSNPTRIISNNERGGDKSAFYLEWRLGATSSLSDRDPDFWNDLKERQMMFPYKLRINYQERDALGNFGTPKTQVFCGQFGYFVDIPLDSADLVPDFIADEGVAALEGTIEAIETVVPHIETAIRVAAIGCGASIAGRTLTRLWRIFISKFEPFLTSEKGDDKCPSDQSKLYLDDNEAKVIAGNQGALKDKCPTTASAWDIETYLDQSYRWTCNRVFCRASPARWTDDAPTERIKSRYTEGQMCGSLVAQATALTRHENCITDKKFNINAARFPTLTDARTSANTCYTDSRGVVYYRPGEQLKTKEEKERDRALAERGLVRLIPIGGIALAIESVPEVDIIAYQPEGTDNYLVGNDLTCKDRCKQSGNYKPAEANQETNDKGCRVQDDSGRVRTHEDKKELSGGYTEDCFPQVEETTPVLRQCVCQAQSEPEKPLLGEARRAEEQGEDWVYRQERIYKESGGRKGTFYSPIRYYDGRDFPSAFGANHVLDVFKDDNNKEIYEINPFSGHTDAFQSMCLSGIRGRLVLLQSILEGMRNCIIQAKETGLQDVGMCKQLFSQYVCGLVYKAIAYAAKGCFPIDFDEAAKTAGATEKVNGIEEGVTDAAEAVYETMSSSITDLQQDYGNAKLNEYFAGGVEGVTRSICLAALGYDWPLGIDQLMDAAYAVPMKTTVLPLAERELVSFNPASQTAVYSYKVATTIFPGCKIRSYQTKLKCVGPEDMGRPGIDCTQQQCDCARIYPEYQVSQQREYPLIGGSGFDVRSGDVVDVPIQSPQIVSDTPYRYDHVVVEIELDQFEKPENCFDPENKDGKFYASIADVSPRPRVECQASIQTGQYRCPDVAGFFGTAGLAYFEFPYASCYSEKANQWMKCDTPNAFLKGQSLRVKPHLYTDGKGQCLHMELQNTGVPWVKDMKIPEGITGVFSPEFDVGQIDQNLFGGSIPNIQLFDQNTASYCGRPANYIPSGPIQQGTYRLTFTKTGTGYLVSYDQGVVIPGHTQGKIYTLAELQGLRYLFGGFEMSGIGLTNDPNTQNSYLCTYQVMPTTSGFSAPQGVQNLNLRLELRVPDTLGSCNYASTQLVQSTLGLSSPSVTIRIQDSEMQTEESGQLHSLFMRAKYDQVITIAHDVIWKQEPTLVDVTAYYYAVAARVMKWSATPDPTIKSQYQQEITNLIGQFNGRTYGNDVTSTTDYKKIKKYLDQIQQALGEGGSLPTPAPSSASSSLCGVSGGLRAGFTPPAGWDTYTCMESFMAGPDRTKCLSYNQYATTTVSGCPGTQLCCPP